MTLLLDTHSFLWFVTDDRRMSAQATALMSDGDNKLFLSVASLWEIAIKVSIGRLPLPGSVEEFIPALLVNNDIDLLSISPAHTFEVAKLPFHHRDPFDRLIIAQSLVEELPIVGADRAFDEYRVQRMW